MLFNLTKFRLAYEQNVHGPVTHPPRMSLQRKHGHHLKKYGELTSTKRKSLKKSLFILAATPSICKGQHKSTCKVVPKNEYIEVGSDTEIVCQTSCIPGKIFWTLNKRRIDESQSSNSSHAVLSLRNFTLQTATLQCLNADTLQALGGTIIRTYSKPSNISCILHHENQFEDYSPDLFTCNWEHQIKPSPHINYTVLIASLSHKSQYEICKSHTTNCTTTSERINLFDNMTITVRAKAAAWEAESDPREFCPDHMLKIISPNLTVETSSDHVLVIVGARNRAAFSTQCHCEVKYNKVVDEGPVSECVRNNTLKKGHVNETIEEFDSCSNYTFSVRCALVEAPWSDWSQKETVLTKLNKRDFKLCLWRKVAEPEENGVRKVHAMWTEIPSTCRGTFTYTVKQTTRNNKGHVMGVNHTDTSCGSSACGVYVNQDAHRITLTVLHNGALLVEDSVYVPAIGESLPQVTDIQTSTLEGDILVSWKASVEPVTGYMIDWTHGGNQSHWKESSYTNTTLSGLLDKQPYDITVTPLFDDKTGHGTQALRICSRVGDPGNIMIQVQSKDKSALVSWNVTSQEACSGAVVTYTVFYRIQKGPQLNVTVNGTEQFISLKDLIPDTQYSVHVNATALTGTTQSRETLFKTKRFDPELITVVSVCGSIVILLGLSLGLCCAVQWKKFKEKPVPNPGLSSLALWPAPSHQEPFSNPSESLCDRVYTGETLQASTSPPAPGCDGNPASVQTEEYIDPATFSAPEDPVEPAETPPHLSSLDDSTALLPSENSPYRSQTSAESSASRCSKQCRRAPVKQTEKIAPVIVYVTLDMLEQHQGRGGK